MAGLTAGGEYKTYLIRWGALKSGPLFYFYRPSLQNLLLSAF